MLQYLQAIFKNIIQSADDAYFSDDLFANFATSSDPENLFRKMILFFATFLERDEKLFSAIPKKGFWEMILSISNDNKNIGSRSNEVILVGSNDIRPTGFISFFQKWAIPGLFFLYFRLFNTVDSKQMFNINFADDWIRTVDLWYWKRPLYQLSHNHCPLASFLISFRGHLFWMSFCVEIKKDGQWQLHIYLPTTRPMCTYLHRDQSFWSLPMGAIRFQRILTCVKCGMADLLFYSFGFNQTSKYVEHLNTTKQLNSNQWNRRSSIQWHFP